MSLFLLIVANLAAAWCVHIHLTEPNKSDSDAATAGMIAGVFVGPLFAMEAAALMRWSLESSGVEVQGPVAVVLWGLCLAFYAWIVVRAMRTEK